MMAIIEGTIVLRVARAKLARRLSLCDHSRQFAEQREEVLLRNALQLRLLCRGRRASSLPARSWDNEGWLAM